MNTKETSFLKVLGDLSFPEKKVVINPNDGFDLGLMMTDATVEIYYNKSPATWEGRTTHGVYGNVYQKNECRLGRWNSAPPPLRRWAAPNAFDSTSSPTATGSIPRSSSNRSSPPFA